MYFFLLLFNIALFQPLAYADSSFGQRTTPTAEVKLQQLLGGFTCTPTLVSHKISETGYGSVEKVAYGSLQLERTDVGRSAGDIRITFNNKPICSIPMSAANDIYYSSADKKILIDSRDGANRYVEAWQLGHSCSYLGWTGITAEQKEYRTFLDESRGEVCQKAKLLTCDDANAFMKKFIALDMTGGRLSGSTELDSYADFTNEGWPNYKYAILTVGAEPTECVENSLGFYVTVHYEIYGKVSGKESNATLEDLLSRTPKEESAEFTLTAAANGLRVIPAKAPPPHIGRKAAKAWIVTRQD